MATLVESTGFESGTVAQNFDAVTGTQTSIDTTLWHTGAKSLLYSIANQANYGTFTGNGIAGSGVVVVRSYYLLHALPATNADAITIKTADGNWAFVFYNHLSGKWAIFQNATIDGTVTVAAGQWYELGIRFTVSANPHVIDWQVNGVAQPSDSANAFAATTITSVNFGDTSTTRTYTANADDVAVSITSADYPLPPVSAHLLTTVGAGS